MTLPQGQSGGMASRVSGDKPLTGRRVLVLLLAFFGVVMLVNFAMVKAAISTFGGVATPSSYQAGLAFKADEARAQAQRQRDWRVNERLDGDGASRSLTVTVADRFGEAVTGIEVSAHLAHPIDERRDQTIALTEVRPGTYRGEANVPPGVWRLDVTMAQSGERMFRSENRIMVP